MHRDIENILQNNILKSFDIKRKIKASDFNKHVYEKKLDNQSRQNFFSKDLTVNKSKPFVKVTPEPDIIEENEENSKESFQIEEFNDKIIKGVQFLYKTIFQEFDDSEEDKEIVVVLMNIINKMIFSTKNISVEDIKRFRDKL